MTSIPSVKDSFNISPEEEAQVLSFLNEQFKTRFTDRDPGFQKALTKGRFRGINALDCEVLFFFPIFLTRAI